MTPVTGRLKTSYSEIPLAFGTLRGCPAERLRSVVPARRAEVARAGDANSADATHLPCATGLDDEQNERRRADARARDDKRGRRSKWKP